MYRYMLRHERRVREWLIEGRDPAALLEYHSRRITWMQHERLVHLLVTLFFALALVVFTVLMAMTGGSLYPILCAITAVLLIFYIFHYYRLENTLQRWYVLADEIDTALRKKSDAAGY